MPSSPTGLIFNIQRFSIHDGPGVRTTVFFKGCALRCFWCHNPEGIRSRPEVLFTPERCIGDAECVAVCPHSAHEFTDGVHAFHRLCCDACGDCVDSCYANALELSGRQRSVDDVLAEILADRAFYETSGGGVTLSGGDPLVQPAFTAALLQACKAEGIHTALETAAHCRWETLAGLLPLTDLVMMDIKHMDPGRHEAATGVSNERILANARRLAESGVSLIVRIPIVPGVNDTPAEIAAIAGFVRSLDGPALELLPFHRLAENKYRSLGLTYMASALTPPSKEQMEHLTVAAAACGVMVKHR